MKTIKAKLPALYAFYLNRIKYKDVVFLLKQNGFACECIHNSTITENHVMVVFARLYSLGEVVIKLAYDKNAIEAITRNYKQIDFYQNNYQFDHLKIPKPIFMGNHLLRDHQIKITIESKLCGKNGLNDLYSADIEKTLSFCFLIWKKNILNYLLHDQLKKRQIIFKFINFYRESLGDLNDINNVLNFLEYLNNQAKLDWMNIGVFHGDYWLGNIIILDQEYIGVIDWDCSSELGLSDLDLVHLVLYTKAQQKHISLLSAWSECLSLDDLTSMSEYFDNKFEFKIILIFYGLSFISKNHCGFLLKRHKNAEYAVSKMLEVIKSSNIVEDADG